MIRIEHEDESRLAIVDRPWVAPVVLLACGLATALVAIARGAAVGGGAVALAVVLAVCAFGAWATSRRSLVVLERSPPVARWRRQRLWSTDEGSVALARVTGAVVERVTDTQGTTRRAALILDDGTRVPFTQHWSTIERHDDVVAAVRRFLSTEDPRT